MSDIAEDKQFLWNHIREVIGRRSDLNTSWNRLCSLAEQAEALRQDWQAEVEGRLALRKEHGARDDETFPAFVGRLRQERDDAVKAQDEAERQAVSAMAMVEQAESRAAALEEKVGRMERLLKEIRQWALNAANNRDASALGGLGARGALVRIAERITQEMYMLLSQQQAGKGETATMPPQDGKYQKCGACGFEHPSWGRHGAKS